MLLIVLAIPLFGLRLGFSDEGNDPKDTTTRQAYDLLAEGFGPGFNGPLVLVAELPAGTDRPRSCRPITTAVQQTPGVVFASPAAPNQDGTAAPLWPVDPGDVAAGPGAPPSWSTTCATTCCRRPRQGTGIDVVVTGSVATQVDFSGYLSAPHAVVLRRRAGLSFLLLMAVFRSVLVPLKAVVMNLLSIGAAYGVVVAIFQWGWLHDIVARSKAAPIEPFVPMMMFAIVFGLSMDYEVFLLSRIKEEWDRTGDSHASVADGLAATARVITAAAAIMVVRLRQLPARADPRHQAVRPRPGRSPSCSTPPIVRMLLVPATMELLGDKNWWLPKWLDRILPHIDVEGPTEAIDAEAAELVAATSARERRRDASHGSPSAARARRAAGGDHRGHRAAARRARPGDRPARRSPTPPASPRARSSTSSPTSRTSSTPPCDTCSTSIRCSPNWRPSRRSARCTAAGGLRRPDQRPPRAGDAGVDEVRSARRARPQGRLMAQVQAAVADLLRPDAASLSRPVDELAGMFFFLCVAGVQQVALGDAPMPAGNDIAVLFLDGARRRTR